MKIRWFNTLPVIIFIALLLCLWLGLGRDTNLLPSALLEKPMPVFTLPDLNNQPLSEKQWQGKVALVNIWATWCLPCRTEHPILLKLAEQGVTIYGLNYKDDYQDALLWLNQRGNPYQSVARDVGGLVAIDWGVYGVPETFVIDKKGNIRYRLVGILTEEAWQKQLKPLMDTLQEE